jgi:hypothetical protein
MERTQYEFKKFQFQPRGIGNQIVKLQFFLAVGAIILATGIFGIKLVRVGMNRDQMSIVPVGVKKYDVVEKQKQVQQHEHAEANPPDFLKNALQSRNSFDSVT